MSEVENTTVEETVVETPTVEEMASEQNPDTTEVVDVPAGIPSEEAAEAEATNVPPAEAEAPVEA